MCLRRVPEKYITGTALDRAGLEQGDALLPLLFNFALEYATRKVQENQVELTTREDYKRLRLSLCCSDL
jgi:hypothetical protein